LLIEQDKSLDEKASGDEQTLQIVSSPTLCVVLKSMDHAD
jgi:hypothetical protein